MNVRKVRDSSGSQGGPNSPRSPSTTLSWKSRSRSSNLPVKTYGGEALLKHKAGPLDAAGVDSSLPPLEGSSTRRVCCSQQQTHQAVLERPPKEAAGRLEPKWLLSLSLSLALYDVICVCVYIYILCIYIYVVFFELPKHVEKGSMLSTLSKLYQGSPTRSNLSGVHFGLAV